MGKLLKKTATKCEKFYGKEAAGTQIKLAKI